MTRLRNQISRLLDLIRSNERRPEKPRPIWMGRGARKRLRVHPVPKAGPRRSAGAPREDGPRREPDLRREAEPRRENLLHREDGTRCEPDAGSLATMVMTGS